MKNNCVCLICKKIFYTFPSEKRRGGGKYCSRRCKDIAQSERMKSESKEKSPAWKGGEINKNCFKCGKEIKVKQHKKNKRVFCSRSCANSFSSGNREKTGKIINCKTCGKEKYWTPCVFKRNQGIFCSMRCRALDNIKNQRKTDTDIERIIELWLIENKVTYTKQKSIENICVSDFFISPNICLFVDGDYWHNPKNRMEIDKRQEIELEKKGYTVFRLKGSEIHKGERFYEILQNHK